jgi:hypothetical protein
MIHWKFIIIGVVLVVLFSYTSIKIDNFSLYGVVISGIIVGYLVNNGYKNGAKNGLIAGFIGGILLGIVDSYFSFIIFDILPKYITFILISGVFYAILSAIGGIVGSLIKNKFIEKSGE